MESFSCFVSLTASCPFSTQIGLRLWFQHLPVKCWLHWVAQLFDLQSGCSVKYDSPGLPFSEHSLSSPFPFMAEMAAYSLHVWLTERVLHGSHTCRCRSWGCVPAVVSAPVRTDSSRHSGKTSPGAGPPLPAALVLRAGHGVAGREQGENLSPVIQQERGQQLAVPWQTHESWLGSWLGSRLGFSLSDINRSQHRSI